MEKLPFLEKCQKCYDKVKMKFSKELIPNNFFK